MDKHIVVDITRTRADVSATITWPLHVFYTLTPLGEHIDSTGCYNSSFA